MNRRPPLLALLMAAAAIALGQPAAHAQPGFPSQPLKIVVATPAGGASNHTGGTCWRRRCRRTSARPCWWRTSRAATAPAVQSVLGATGRRPSLLWAMSSMAMPMLVKASPVRSMSEFAPVVGVVNLVWPVRPPKGAAGKRRRWPAHLQAHPGQTGLWHGRAPASTW